jgi:hypothetical protein
MTAGVGTGIQLESEDGGDGDSRMLTSGTEIFTVDDMYALSELVGRTWTSVADRDWSGNAGTLEWSCLATADHAVDCVYAPVFFLASRKTDGYPTAGLDLRLGDQATPQLLVQSLHIATRLLAAIAHETDPDVRSVIFLRPRVLLGAPVDFVPRAAMELIVHAHDVCAGLGVGFEPPADLCRRLREHTRPWPIWNGEWNGLGASDDPWADLLSGSGRSRTSA